MYYPLLLLLLALKLGSAQQCDIAVIPEEKLKEEIKQQSDMAVQWAVENITGSVQQLLDPVVQHLQQHLRLGRSPAHPATSCKEISDKEPNSTCGYYWIQAAKGPLTQKYCDMERERCSVTGGWMQVADIDMRRLSDTCPSGLNLLQEGSKRLCSMSISGGGCSSAVLSVHKVQYSNVCGKIIGYQQKSPDAFSAYHHNPSLTVDDCYVD